MIHSPKFISVMVVIYIILKIISIIILFLIIIIMSDIRYLYSSRSELQMSLVVCCGAVRAAEWLARYNQLIPAFTSHHPSHCTDLCTVRVIWWDNDNLWRVTVTSQITTDLKWNFFEMPSCHLDEENLVKLVCLKYKVWLLWTCTCFVKKNGEGGL